MQIFHPHDDISLAIRKRHLPSVMQVWHWQQKVGYILFYIYVHTLWYLTPSVHWRGKNHLLPKRLQLHFSQKIKIIYRSSSLCPNQARNKKQPIVNIFTYSYRAGRTGTVCIICSEVRTFDIKNGNKLAWQQNQHLFKLKEFRPR